MGPGSDPATRREAVWISKARLEAFSDGVFAIAITLLVLDLAVGSGAGSHLLTRLLDLWPSYLAYLTSFLTIGLVWIGHHMVIGMISRVSGTLLRINLGLLLVVADLPFPTRLLGEFVRTTSAERVAAVLYGVWVFLIAAALAAMWRHSANGRRLLSPDLPQAEIDSISRILEPRLGFYVAAIVLAFIAPRVAAGLFFVVAAVGLLRAT